MRRLPATPRPDWKDQIEAQGLIYSTSTREDGTQTEYWHENAYYEFSMAEIEHLEEVTENLHQMCLEAAKYLATGAMGNLGLPPGAFELAKASLERQDPDVYGRFDFAYDGTGEPKLLEYNADTPTGLIEAAVCQWHWLQTVKPENDQWNGIHEALVQRWKWYAERTGEKRIHFTHVEWEESGEDWMTTAYLRDTAEQAGLEAVSLNLKDIGWDSASNRFVDMENRPIDVLFKLYPWELMAGDQFAKHITEHPFGTRFVEPAWKMFLSTKALLAALWELYPNHPNLLPAYLGEPRELTEWVAKPLHGREGDNIIIHAHDVHVEQPGPYGEEGWCYQAWHPLPDFDGKHPVLGAWTVGGVSVGVGIRESDGYVTDYFCRFVPNVIDAPAPAL